MTDWSTWLLGPLVGAAAGATITGWIDRRRQRTSLEAGKQATVDTKLQDHEIRIAILESKASLSRARVQR